MGVPIGDCNSVSHLPKSRASKLDMDHVYLPFLDFLWGNTFVTPCTVFLAAYGSLSLVIRDKMTKMGILRQVKQ